MLRLRSAPVDRAARASAWANTGTVSVTSMAAIVAATARMQARKVRPLSLDGINLPLTFYTTNFDDA